MDAFADLPLEPLSDRYGWDRGTPLDRYYIEAFLAERRDAIWGSVGSRLSEPVRGADLKAC